MLNERAAGDQDLFYGAANTTDPNSPINGLDFRQGPEFDGAISTILLDGATFLYLDDPTGNMVLTDYDTHNYVGVATLGAGGYLQWTKAQPSTSFPKWSKADGALKMVGKEDYIWSHCPLAGYVNRTVALSEEVPEGCERLNQINVYATD
ncbi:hypothetical protein PISL3812_07861 [Talaromyces islandicus]|uniref:Uncharacterized protein n=1 Tax=Talaromyces islandicus TaxID=28573 RepID=A0A0U1M5M5_TALIS|nr:hypothetical protein PISL3812_07861 [Talaromyces islandicus]